LNKGIAGVFFIHHNYHHPAARRRRLLLGPTVLAAFFFGQRLRRLAWLILALPLTLLWLLDATPSAKAAGFTVNSTADGGDANPGDGICQTSTPGQCALRAAIEEANALGGADTINFDIPGSGPHTITPAGGLPAITKPVAIDGTSQPGFAGTPIIEIDGNNQAKDGFWLKPGSDGSTIRGFVINDFVGGSGIEIESSGNTIVGNYLGTNVAGTAVDGNATTSAQTPAEPISATTGSRPTTLAMTTPVTTTCKTSRGLRAPSAKALVW
jgi:CSLREA domain-containing protein